MTKPVDVDMKVLPTALIPELSRLRMRSAKVSRRDAIANLAMEITMGLLTSVVGATPMQAMILGAFFLIAVINFGWAGVAAWCIFRIVVLFGAAFLDRHLERSTWNDKLVSLAQEADNFVAHCTKYGHSATPYMADFVNDTNREAERVLRHLERLERRKIWSYLKWNTAWANVRTHWHEIKQLNEKIRILQQSTAR